MKNDERKWLSDVARLGCVVCRNEGHGDSPAEIHHIRTGQGISQRATNYKVLPLCPAHHRLGGHGVAIHAGQYAWEHKYGAELELLAQIKSEVEALRGMKV